MTYDKLPTLKQWQSDSSVALKFRDKDVVLKRADELLGSYHLSTDNAQRFIYLSDLYFTADYWLKIYQTNPLMEKGRAPAMHALFTRAAFDLCEAFQCTINGLPRELELMWGREMSRVGVKKDLQLGHAEYITRAEAAKYKVYFKNGKAYQYPWWDPSAPWKRVPAESRYAFDQQAFVRAALKPEAFPNRDYGFFVLTMSRDLYMTKHRAGGDNNKGFFHSSYTAGDPVSCAGTMLVQAGSVRRVRFDSGHFMPHVNNARALVMALQMFGVPLGAVVFEDFNGFKLGYNPTPGAVQAADIGTANYILRNTATMSNLNANRTKTLWDNQVAHGERPPANPDPRVKGPSPRDWWGNRPGQREVAPPAIKKP